MHIIALTAWLFASLYHLFCIIDGIVNTSCSFTFTLAQ